MAKDRETSTKEAVPTPGPELRLVDRRAFIGFPPLAVSSGIVISDFGLQIPDVTFPFNVTGGPSRYQKRRLNFGFLELTVDAEVVLRRLVEISRHLVEINDLRLNFRLGYIEGQGRLASGERTPFTFKLAFDGDTERLALFIYDVRMYGFSTTPAAQLPVVLSRAVESLGLLPEVQTRGATGFSTRILPILVQLGAVSRGYKMPALDYARLSAAEVSTQGLRLRFSSGGLAPPATPDEDLLLALEGSRAFAEAEELIASGRLAEAREAYLKLGDINDAHPFAAERLLTLMVADPQAHEMVLDLAASVSRRRERSATAMWAEAVVRERRREPARAAERYLALCAHARNASEDASAFFAAESAARVARDEAPQMAVKALHELLGIRPDHLPSLQALARAADRAQDRGGAIRAYRRIAALARDTTDAADAHVHLAQLCALTEDDVAGARLHCEAALKLSPDHPDALYQLGELCHRAGEHLRAIKALDRLREVALGRHEIERVGRANLMAGQVWENGLQQLENALLRYREAVSLMPGEPEPLVCAARAAEKLGKIQEAVGNYLQAIELAGPSPKTDAIRKAIHHARHAMARLSRTHLAEPARAHEHFEAALALDPRDATALEELLPYFRTTGRAAPLADALEKSAAVTSSPERRAALWAEAGEIYRSRLGRPEQAERLLASALEADPRNTVALEGMLALAEARRDGVTLCRTLKALAEMTSDPKVRVRHLRRLAVGARDLTFDLDLAAYALSEVHKIEPDDLPILGELCALHRRRGDMDGLAKALEFRAATAEAHSDHRLAAAVLRELAQVLEARLGRLGEALISLEKAARLSPDASILLDLADLSMRCERPANARRALEDLLLAQPAHVSPERLADIRARLGKACDLLGDKEAAKEHYARAFPLRKLDHELGHRLEALYEQAGQAREVAELWATRAQALLQAQRGEEAAPLFLRSARALLRSGEKPGAVLRFQAALDAAPAGSEAAEILRELCELELERGAKTEAAKLMARRATLVPEPRSAAKLFLGAAGLISGTAREPEFIASALEKDPQFAAARARRAELRVDAEPGLALQDLEAAIDTLASDPDAPTDEERLLLRHRAFQAALKADRLESARRHLTAYVADRPDDLSAQKELATLHRRAGAKDALFDILAQLWSRLPSAEQEPALREYAELSLELGSRQASLDALYALLTLAPRDVWAARTLYGLLGADSARIPPEQEVSLLSVLIGAADADEKGQFLTRRARVYRQSGDLRNARDDLQGAASCSSQPGPLWRELAQLGLELEDPGLELAAWRQVTLASPELCLGSELRILELANGRFQAADYATAKDAYSIAGSLLGGKPEGHQAWRGLAQSAMLLGEKPTAITALSAAAKEGSYRERAEALFQRGSLLEEMGNVADAAQSYENALALAPTDVNAQAGLKRTLRILGNWQALAEVLASEATRTPKQNAGPLYEEIGALYLEKLSLKGPAEAAFRRAAQLQKGNVTVRRKLISLLVEAGRFEEAAETSEQVAASLAPQDAALVLRETAQQASPSDTEIKIRLLRKAHALSAAKGIELEELSRLLYLQGSTREAFELTVGLTNALDFDDQPDQAEVALLRLADLAEQLGNREMAESALRRILQERSFSREAAERLSSLLSFRSPRESIEVMWSYARASAPSERTATLLMTLAARAHNELLDLELAAEILLRATEIAPDPLPAHRRLAKLYEDSRRTEELGKELEQIAALSMARGDVAAARETFIQLSGLAESLGHIDDALRRLEKTRELFEQAGQIRQAAHFERRRGELLRDAKLDLPEALRAFERCFNLDPSLETAQLGASLAGRQGDSSAEVDWLHRAYAMLDSETDRAQLLIRLAQLFDGPLRSSTKAEETLREALSVHPSSLEAERLLSNLLVREGRPAALASFWEERAQQEADSRTKAALLTRAARLYRDEAGDPDSAVSALLAARAAAPDDLEIVEQAADLLYEMGRVQEASEFDETLLHAEPFRPRIFKRRTSFLEGTRDYAGLGELFIGRASQSSGEEAAEYYLRATEAFRYAGAEQRALLCEALAFDSAPQNDQAFGALRARMTSDPRRFADVLARRAEALPHLSSDLLRERAMILLNAGDGLRAAEALDELLARVPEDVAALTARAALAAEGGGALASQPFDRRLLEVAGDSLPLVERVRLYLRLGNASLASGAYRDAAEALETVVELDPGGPRGREALSLLGEVHARTQNAHGLLRTSVALANTANAEEAEALLRRAAALFDDPKDAIDALVPLSRLRPADITIVERTAEALEGLGRHAEVVDLLSRSAELVGGRSGAQMLMRAGEALQNQLGDREQARVFRARAATLDLTSVEALRALVAEQREHGTSTQLREALRHFLQAGPPPDEAARAELDLAGLAESEGDWNTATQLLEQVIDRGPGASGYAEALNRLLMLLQRTGVTKGFEELANERGSLLLRAANEYERANMREEARALLERMAREHPRLISDEELAARYSKVGAPELALASLMAAFARYKTERDFDQATRVAQQALAIEKEPRARSALHLELGELALLFESTEPQALELLETALAEDAENLVALKHLVRLYAGTNNVERFVALAERLVETAGRAALSPEERELLANVYSQTGKKEEARSELSLLPETPQRLQARAILADELGFHGESLQLREKLAENRDEREAILVGYSERNLIPFAVRLGTALLADGPLKPGTARLLAERLSASVEGPELAARVWPELLRANIHDADGWTLYAEALRQLGRQAEAEMIDGFGAALTTSDATAPLAPMSVVARGVELAFPPAIPPGLVEISNESMPRLSAVLQPAFSAFGAPETVAFLDSNGGSYAYLASSTQMVIGAGALGCFGPAEMIYLTSLALALGDRGWFLTGPDPIPEFDDAACAAFVSNPSSLAASRVISILDPAVRGSDPKLIDQSAVLQSSEAFRKIANRALSLIR